MRWKWIKPPYFDAIKRKRVHTFFYIAGFSRIRKRHTRATTMSTPPNTPATRKRMIAMLPQSLTSSDYVKTRIAKVRGILLKAVGEIIDEDTVSFDDDLEIEVMNRMSETLCLLQQAILIDEQRESSKRIRVRSPEPEQAVLTGQTSADSTFDAAEDAAAVMEYEEHRRRAVARGDTLNGRGLAFDRVARAMRREAARAIRESVEREEY